MWSKADGPSRLAEQFSCVIVSSPVLVDASLGRIGRFCSNLAGVNLGKVQKIYIAVGDRRSPAKHSTSRIHIDAVCSAKRLEYKVYDSYSADRDTINNFQEQVQTGSKNGPERSSGAVFSLISAMKPAVADNVCNKSARQRVSILRNQRISHDDFRPTKQDGS
jgi:hypothetical protein